jgi:hypothetical protein
MNNYKTKRHTFYENKAKKITFFFFYFYFSSEIGVEKNFDAFLCSRDGKINARSFTTILTAEKEEEKTVFGFFGSREISCIRLSS